MRINNIFLIWGLFSIVFNGFGGENLITNGSFEGGKITQGETPVIGWRSRGYTLKYQHIVSDTAYSGKRSALLEMPENISPKETAYFMVDKDCPLKPGKSYRISIWAKPEIGKGSLRLVLYNSKKQFAGMGGVREIPIISDVNVKTFRNYTLDVLIPANDKNGYFYKVFLQLQGGGKIYFDDLSIAEIETKEFKVDFYPSSINSEKTIYVLRGETQQLMIYPYTSQKDKNLILELNLPKGITVLEAIPVYVPNAKATKFSLNVINNRNIYHIPLDKKAVMPMEKYTSTRIPGTGLLFDIAKNCQDGEIIWSLKRGNVSVFLGKIKLKAIEPVRGKLPKNFRIVDWYSPLLSFLNNPNNVNRYLDTLMASGFWAASIEGDRHADLFNRRNFQNRRTFAPGRAKNKCMTSLVENEYFFSWVNTPIKGLKGYKNPALCWNFEPGMDEYYHLCQRCRQAFEKFSSKSAKNFKSAVELEKAYPKEYFDFNANRYYKLFKRYAEVCRNANVQSVLCCYARGTTSEANQRIAKMVGRQEEYFPLLSKIQPMIYHQPENLWDMQKVTMDFWKDAVPVYTTDEISNGNTPAYALLTPERLATEIWIAALQGAKEVSLFVGAHPLDGRLFNTLRKTLDEISLLDNFDLSNAEPSGIFKLVKSSTFVRSKLYFNGKNYLLAIINPDLFRNGNISFKIIPPFKKYVLSNIKNNLLYCDQNKNEFRGAKDCNFFNLSPGEVLLLQIDNVDTFKNKTMKKAFFATPPDEIISQQLFNQGGFKVLEKEGVITIYNSNNSMQILRNDGGVLAGKGIFAPGGGVGGFFRDLISYPTAAKWGPDCKLEYKTASIKLVDKQLEIVLVHSYKQQVLQGLRLIKTFRFASDMKKIQVGICLKNQGNTPISIAYWNHNRINRAKANTIITLADNTVIKNDNPQRNNYYYPAAKSQTATALELCKLQWHGNEWEQLYFWLGSDNPSMEMLSKKFSIPAKSEKNFNITFEVLAK